MSKEYRISYADGTAEVFPSDESEETIAAYAARSAQRRGTKVNRTVCRDFGRKPSNSLKLV